MQVQKVSSSLWIVQCPVSDFKIKMLNAPKKVSGLKNYANASFFGYFDESNPKAHFTLPIGHVVCDLDLPQFDKRVARNYWCDYYMKQRGPSNGNKVAFDGSAWNYLNDQFHGKSLTTLTIKNGVANIVDLKSMDLSYTYAIMGVPLMKEGNDVSWANYVKKQGWYGSELYGTYHTILAIKKANDTNVYVIGWRSTSGNMVSSGEAYKMLKKYGFYSAIKLDGGGSFLLDVNGSRMQTSENRQIDTIVMFEPSNTTEISPVSSSTTTIPAETKLAPQNPYTVPKRVIKQGCIGSDVKWVQWFCHKLGYAGSSQTLDKFCDGSFGPGTKKAVMAMQKGLGLSADGCAGPATQAKLKTL